VTKQKRSYHKDKREVANWHYDEKNDHFMIWTVFSLSLLNYSTSHDKHGAERNFRVYRAVKYFENPIWQGLATLFAGLQEQK